MRKVSFMVACKEYFGMKPEQKLGEFMMEIRQLTDADRTELSALFPSVGFEII